MKYKSKFKQIEAIRFEGGLASCVEIADTLKIPTEKYNFANGGIGTGKFYIHNHPETTWTTEVGEWVVKEVEPTGEVDFYPLSQKEINEMKKFDKLYRDWIPVTSKNSSVDCVLFDDLNFANWHPDSLFASIYLHVANKNGDTWHRVYPKSKKVKRVGMLDGKLCWMK